MVNGSRCSEWTRSQGVDPIGTAGSYAGFLLVEWNLPWPRDVSQIPELTEVALEAKRRKVRFQVVTPMAAERTVCLYRWDPELGSYVGHEAPCERDAAEVALTLLDCQTLDEYEKVTSADVLICGHGRRDRCCGSLGTSLELTLSQSGLAGENVRIRRTSHTGGHRFAPTAVILPEGTCWGYLDADSLRHIVARDESPRQQLHRYRGCTGLSRPGIQALEGALLGEIGWELLDWARFGEELDDGRVRLTATTCSGALRRWEASVTPRRFVPVPPCGQSPSGQDKVEPELLVENLEELPA